jgi:hypothetical protein
MQAQSRPTDRPRFAKLLVAVAGIAVVGLGIWGVFALLDGGPVPAGEALVEIGFTGDATSFEGDREIIEGTVEVAFTNDTDAPAVVYFMYYETGSVALAEELAAIEEGGKLVTSDAPTEGYVEVYGDTVEPGTYTWSFDMSAGNTYLFDVGPEDFHQSGIWRMAVIEVIEP